MLAGLKVESWTWEASCRLAKHGAAAGSHAFGLGCRFSLFLGTAGLVAVFGTSSFLFSTALSTFAAALLLFSARGLVALCGANHF